MGYQNWYDGTIVVDDIAGAAAALAELRQPALVEHLNLRVRLAVNQAGGSLAEDCIAGQHETADYPFMLLERSIDSDDALLFATRYVSQEAVDAAPNTEGFVTISRTCLLGAGQPGKEAGTLEQELARSALSDWIAGYEAHGDGTATITVQGREKAYDEGDVFEALAPFARSGSVYGEGDEGEEWKDDFLGGRIFSRTPRTLWPPEPEPYRQPLPGDLVDGQVVVASVVYSDVQVEDTPPDRFEVLLMRLMPEPPYFEVGTWDCRPAGEPVPMPDDQRRFYNIVEAVRDYEQSGGDI